MSDVINIKDKLSQFSAQWTPHIIAGLNGQLVKLAKLEGDFVWHSHDNQDELFMVIKGVLHIELEERTVQIHEGEIFVVPRNTMHRPFTNGEEVHVLLFEPADTKHTGDVISERTVTQDIWI